MRGVGRALRHRNYRLFFTGQGISLIGMRPVYVRRGILEDRAAEGAGRPDGESG